MRTNHRSIRTLLAGALAAGSVALVMPASPVQAADVTVTIVDGNGDPIERAMIAFVDADGAALAGAIADEEGKVTIDDADAAGYVVSAPGYGTIRGATVPADASTVTLTASDSSSLSYSNAYGAQVSGVFADGEPGVFYITTDGIPSVWRTLDYAGTWAPVPTTAFSDDGLPQSNAGGLVTSGYPGEVAVVITNAVWYSTDFGTTWDSISLPTGLNNPVVRWAHSVDGTDNASVILVAASDWSAAQAADMTAESPVFASIAIGGIVELGGADGKVFLVEATTTSTTVEQITLGSGGWTRGAAATINMSLAASPDDRDALAVATLSETATSPDAVLLYEHTAGGGGHTGDFELAVNSSGTWSAPISDLAGQGGNNDTPFDRDWDATYIKIGTGHIDYCGENGTGTAISIAPKPGAGTFDDFGVIGTVGNCMWGLNTSGAAADWPGATSAGSAQLASNEVGVVYLDGINNNTGFAWSASYDFSTDMVAIAPNEAGIAKSANIVGHRPSFGQRGARSRDDFILNLASPGTATDSGGIAINGLTAAVVRDIVMDPNDPTGQNYALITSSGGGSRVMLTTDGGESFSTVSGSGGESMAWWNGDGVEMMAAFAGLNGELSVKPFDRDATGTDPWQMSEEFAMTAAEREDDTTGFSFSPGGLRPSVAYDGANRTYLAGLAKDGGGQNGVAASAMVGVTGTNKILIAGSRISGGGGSVDADYSAGSVGILELTVDATTKEVTESDFTIFGTNLSSATGGDPYDAFNDLSPTQDGAYNGGVTSIAYCPVGSAASVADTAFITVSGGDGSDDGVYKIVDVSGAGGAPTHSAVTTDPALTELRVDCDTGLMIGVVPGAGVGAPGPTPGGGAPGPTPGGGAPGPTPGTPVAAAASDPGVYLSTDGVSFVRMTLTVTNPDTLDIQAEPESGEITMVVAGGNGDVTSVEMNDSDLGIDLEAMADAPEGDPVDTPESAVQPPADGVVPLNSSEDGINTGGVADIELPPSADDVALEGEVGAASVRRSVKALADDVPVSIGSASGAFASSVGAASAGGTDADPTFVPLTPARILDTRNAVGAPAARVGALDGSGAPLELTVAGKGGVPATGIGAVALNVTVVDGQANDFGGFVTVYPCGTRPDSSNLNFVSGQTIPNSVIAPVSSSGKVCFYVYGTANLLADVSGYFASGFSQLTPARILDTRNAVGAPAARVGAIDGSGSALELTVAGKGGVPSSGV
ncbi:MAG: hypothetical protein O3C33_00935, partial [Actinomycetota bacterium]|nr:hypothetical protein [Actinomycetota bacterium]